MCPASCALPQAPDVPGEAARRGTDIHAFLVDALTTSREEALTRTKRPVICARINMEKLRSIVCVGDYTFEKVHSYDPDADTGIDWSQEIKDRSGYLDNGQVFGTPDVLCFNHENMIIWDYKTGKHAFYENELPQLKMLALATRDDRFFIPVRYMLGLIHPLTGECEVHGFSNGELDGFRLDVIQAVNEAKEAHNAIANGQDPVVVTGDHCQYCRSIKFCPAYKP